MFPYPSLSRGGIWLLPALAVHEVVWRPWGGDYQRS